MSLHIPEKPVRRPPALKPGGRIGVAAPASPFDKKRFETGVNLLRERGFEVVLPEGLFSRKRYLAGDDDHRLAILRDLFSDPSIDAVWCARGGYGSMRLLERPELDNLGLHPKAFIGLSDITALLNHLVIRCKMATFHGPMITTLADADQQSIDHLFALLGGGGVPPILARSSRVIVSGKAEGRVLGGNLSTLVHLLGTPYFPDFKGSIVFLEDIGEKPYRIDRMLTQLLLSGSLEQAKGVIFGSFMNCGAEKEIETIAAERFSSLSIPVMSGFPSGHAMPCLTLPLGISARLDTDEGSLCYLESALE